MKRHTRPIALLLVLTAAFLCFLNLSIAHAQGGVVNSGQSSAPEIDPSMVGGGVALLTGVILVLRSRRKR